MELVAMAVVWVFGMALVVGLIVTPLYLAVEGARAAAAFLRPTSRRRPATRELARTEAELKEQYASGILTLVGLEERFEAASRATTQLELQHVLDDLPRSAPGLPRAAVVELLSGLALLLALDAPAARAAGALLVCGVLVPPARWRVVAAAFLAGVALVTAPLAAIPLGLGAGLRWLDERRS